MTAVLQAGLQGAEQRALDAKPATTLAARMEDRQVAARIGVAAAQFSTWANQQAAALDGLARLAPAIRDAASRAVASVRPALEATAERIRQRPERVAARQREAALDTAREQLVALRMVGFQRWQRRVGLSSSLSTEQQWAQEAGSEERKHRAAVRAMPETELREVLQQEQAAQQAQERQKQRAAARPSGSSPSPGW